MRAPEIDLTVPQSEWSIDGVPTTVEPRTFDGKDKKLIKILFDSITDGSEHPEISASVTTFGFNGTALLTPSAFDRGRRQSNLDTLDRRRLGGPLLVLDLKEGAQYGSTEMAELLRAQDIDPNRRYGVPEYIVLFRTRLMNAVLNTADERGVPDYGRLGEVQRNRPGILPSGARLLAKTGLAQAVMIDNISFEPFGSDDGFQATQHLMGLEKPNRPHIFTPLVYHVNGTEGDDFVETFQFAQARIEMGNPPLAALPGYPVGVFAEDSRRLRI
ncbi:hypothetical protein CO046_01530 [Candidatus Peregrinibacteria bacterium CG_4_9_14_0_2_um_filter_53_11]|nr:MAG: hypothetical protein CO046_01530 [Candidatus Peregrinibacteria bacterium CG_4_9_14_0_2_um_filter_53_11]